jgi:hypothetical protein
MGAFFGAIFSWLLGLIFKRPSPPSRVEVQTDRAARAEVQRDQQAMEARAQADIAKAVTDAPKDVAGTAAKLRKGTF